MSEKVDNKESIEKQQNWLLIGAAVILVLLAAYFLLRAPVERSSSITGRVNFVNLKPQEGNENKGSITLYQRELIDGEKTDFTITGADIVFEDDADWKWDSAVIGKTYELKADLLWDGEFIESSNIITTVAPAAAQILIFDISIDDVPENILESVSVPVSGFLDINGFIPDDSTVDIYQKQVGTGQWIKVLSDLSAKDKSRWVWKTATPNKNYEIKAVMMNSAEEIGESLGVIANPPQSEVILSIESTAKAPGAIISGEVQINGAVVNNTSVVMLQSISGKDSFEEFQTLSAIDGVEFYWGNAISDQAYDIKAELREKDEKISSSNTVSSVAPSSDLALILDTNLILSTPKESPRVSCKDQDKESNYEASITYPRIEGAERYYVQVGTEKDSSNVYNSVIENDNPNEDIKVSVKVSDGTEEYTSYAYTYCSNCDVTDRQNWSALSPITKFECPSE